MADTLIRLDHVTYRYDEEARPALKDLNLSFEKGSTTAVLGHNGSGKSTLAKLLNGLFIPSEGTVLVDGMDTRDEKNTWEIRRRAGMVFQNPDNQLVASIVRDDVAFGLENIGVDPAEMPGRIEQALTQVGMLPYMDRAPHTLSGGQKQRIAIAGVLAMLPQALILDEATAMLDPRGRAEVLDTVLRLNREQGITVLWITHFMEEAARFERVLVMSEGEVRMDGAPSEVFSRADELRALRLDMPPMAALAEQLRLYGIPLPAGVMDVESLAKEVLQCQSSAHT